MGEEKTQWEPWYTLLPDNKVQCNFCQTKISYRRDRLLFHLGYRPDDTLPGVKRCNKAPLATRAMFRNCGGNVPTVEADKDERGVEVTSPSTVRVGVVHGQQPPNVEASISEGGGNTVGQSS